jgi:hypothetical protein
MIHTPDSGVRQEQGRRATQLQEEEAIARAEAIANCKLTIANFKLPKSASILFNLQLEICNLQF